MEVDEDREMKRVHQENGLKIPMGQRMNGVEGRILFQTSH